jgi:hypothetical protein
MLAVCILPGCLLEASKPAPELEALAPGSEIGPRPEDDVVLRAFRAWSEEQLRDPTSAMYRLVSMYPGHVINHAPDISGWVVTLQRNAKNGFGGYVGWREERWLVREGRLMALETQREEHYGGHTQFFPLCLVVDSPIAIADLTPKVPLASEPK